MTKEGQIERKRRQRNCKEKEIAKIRMVQALQPEYRLVAVAVVVPRIKQTYSQGLAVGEIGGEKSECILRVTSILRAS